jgi:hypothetical protein
VAERTPVNAGTKYGRLLALANGTAATFQVPCRCDCGVEVRVRVAQLVTGKTRSCGCLQREITGARRRTHGKSRTPEHRAWRGMLDRCTLPTHISYPYYGGRGITVCERWRSFANFLADMGPKPTSKHTLDRINGNGNYEPSNCRWATWSEQNRNRGPEAYAGNRNRRPEAYDHARNLPRDPATGRFLPKERRP